MSKQAAEHHHKAAEHHEHAAAHHREAARHHENDNHETAAHHAHTAQGHYTTRRTMPPRRPNCMPSITDIRPRQHRTSEICAERIRFCVPGHGSGSMETVYD